MVKVFDSNQSRRVSEILQDTLRVDVDGSVSFRAAVGKGSGRAIRIPGDEFDEFVQVLTETASRRSSLADAASQATSEVSTDDVTNDETVE